MFTHTAIYVGCVIIAQLFSYHLTSDPHPRVGWSARRI